MGSKKGTKGEDNMKSLVKEAIKELLSDETFLDFMFKKITDKVNSLETALQKSEERITVLETKIERMQQNEKQNNLCIYGMQEEDNEKLNEKVLQLFNNKMTISIKRELIVKSYRTGNKNHKNRPVIVKFDNNYARNLIYTNRKNLKGQGPVIVEDLIKSKLNLYQEAQMKLGKKNVYTWDGNVFVIDKNKQKHKVIKNSDLLNIIQNNDFGIE